MIEPVTSTSQSTEPPSPPGSRLVSRPLLLGWCLWLLVSWGLNVLLDDPVSMPTVRWMLLSALVGLLLAWPAWRLSIASPIASTAATLTDLFLLLAIFQILIVRVSIDWPIDHAMLIDAAVVVYALAAAMLIDLGRRGGLVGRTVAMTLCLAILVGPALALGATTEPVRVALSPIRAVWVLADPRTMVDAAVIGRTLAAVAGAIVIIWIAGRVLMKVRENDLPTRDN